MDTLTAFAMGNASRGKEAMVFDWDKAAQMILEMKADEARAGLSGDWEWTGGYIYEDGKPDFDGYTFLASTWATPEIEIDGEVYDCYKMKSETEWRADTKWPESAIDILKRGLR
jgi:hypothetical protein